MDAGQKVEIGAKTFDRYDEIIVEYITNNLKIRGFHTGLLFPASSLSTEK
jgi:hypothetical protein